MLGFPAQSPLAFCADLIALAQGSAVEVALSHPAHPLLRSARWRLQLRPLRENGEREMAQS
jgi:hypothetical protein